MAQSCRKALEAPVSGAPHYVIAAADTVMERDSADLMGEYFPNVPLRKTLQGRETLLSIEKAREELGYEPEYSWRDQ